MKWRVLITCPYLQQSIDRYRDCFMSHLIDIESPPVTQRMTESDLLEIIDRFDGVIAGDDEFTANVLEKGRRLKVIAKWGVGVDAIDLNAARRLGIRVANTPNVFSDDVADVVMGYIVLLARQLHRLDQSVRRKDWQKPQGVSLRGKTLGVVGVGNIGRGVVRRAVVSGMVVVGYDVTPEPGLFVAETGLCFQGLEDLLKASDFVSLNCNLTPANHHMIGPSELAMMKTGVYIINTARGALINEAALVQVLCEGKVAGAALDVFDQEPLPLDSPLRQFDNCVFGTHNSSNTLEGILRANEMAIRNLLNGLGVADS